MVALKKHVAREKTQLELAREERRDREREQQWAEGEEARNEARRQRREAKALANGKRLIGEFFPHVEKGQTFIYRMPALIEAEEGTLNNQQLWGRNCSDVIKYCIDSKRRRSDRFIFTPGPDSDKTFREVGFLKIEVAWTERMPVRKAA